MSGQGRIRVYYLVKKIKIIFLYDKCLKYDANGSEILAPHQDTGIGVLETFSAVFRDVKYGKTIHWSDGQFKREENFQKVVKFESFLQS